MPIQNVLLSWGTYIEEGYPDTSRYGSGSPRIGIVPINRWVRPIFKFASDGLSGQIQSVSFNFYCDKTGGSNADFTIHKVNKAVATDATWYYADYSSLPWTGQGCAATEEDRTAASLTATQGFVATGWTSFAVNNLSLFNLWFAGQRAIILVNSQTPTDYASIALDPAPYLAIEYKTSLIGGIQIF